MLSSTMPLIPAPIHSAFYLGSISYEWIKKYFILYVGESKKPTHKRRTSSQAIILITWTISDYVVWCAVHFSVVKTGWTYSNHPPSTAITVSISCQMATLNRKCQEESHSLERSKNTYAPLDYNIFLGQY